MEVGTRIVAVNAIKDSNNRSRVLPGDLGIITAVSPTEDCKYSVLTIPQRSATAYISNALSNDLSRAAESSWSHLYIGVYGSKQVVYYGIQVPEKHALVKDCKPYFTPEKGTGGCFVTAERVLIPGKYREVDTSFGSGSVNTKKQKLLRSDIYRMNMLSGT
eukprot:1079890-Amorphochlora_amoeboformis.AAC.2